MRRIVVAVVAGLLFVSLPAVLPGGAAHANEGYGANPGTDFDSLSAAGNDDPRDLWSDGTTMWVSDVVDGKLYAYTMATRTRDSSKDLELHADNESPFGIWADDDQMWVLDTEKHHIYVYSMATADFGTRLTDDEWALNSVHVGGSPAGLWSDGDDMWVFEAGPSNSFGPPYEARMSIRWPIPPANRQRIWATRGPTCGTTTKTPTRCAGTLGARSCGRLPKTAGSCRAVPVSGSATPTGTLLGS